MQPPSLLSANWRARRGGGMFAFSSCMLPLTPPALATQQNNKQVTLSKKPDHLPRSYPPLFFLFFDFSPIPSCEWLGRTEASVVEQTAAAFWDDLRVFLQESGNAIVSSQSRKRGWGRGEREKWRGWTQGG
jgi:hypothetical protein